MTVAVARLIVSKEQSAIVRTRAAPSVGSELVAGLGPLFESRSRGLVRRWARRGPLRAATLTKNDRERALLLERAASALAVLLLGFRAAYRVLLAEFTCWIDCREVLVREELANLERATLGERGATHPSDRLVE